MNCDWCGEPIMDGERTLPGYKDLPTHVRCCPAAWRAYREDHQDRYELESYEREPFTDWPNNQGTYD